MTNLLARILPKRTAIKTVTHAPPMPGNHASRQSNHLAIKTVIAAGAVVEGDLRLKENIIINGVVRGDVIGDGCLVLIKETGVVTGAVRASKIYLAGEVRGGVRAKFLRLFPTARVMGSIGAQSIVVDMGASLQCNEVVSGGTTIDQPVAEDLSPEASAKQPDTTTSDARVPAAAHVAPLVSQTTRHIQPVSRVDHSRSEHGIGASAAGDY